MEFPISLSKGLGIWFLDFLFLIIVRFFPQIYPSNDWILFLDTRINKKYLKQFLFLFLDVFKQYFDF
jgi:hypothetical protein